MFSSQNLKKLTQLTIFLIFHSKAFFSNFFINESGWQKFEKTIPKRWAKELEALFLNVKVSELAEKAGFSLLSSTISFFLNFTLTLYKFKSIINLLLVFFVLLAALANFSEFLDCNFISLSFFILFNLCNVKTWSQIVRLTIFNTSTHIKPQSASALSSLSFFPDFLEYIIAISSSHFEDIIF